jgi:dynein heavy chain
MPRKQDPLLEDAVVQACANAKLTGHEAFRLKIVQLSELLEIRHSVFVMGNPGAGKSQTWKMLAAANAILGKKTMCQDLNPKVVGTRDLYGYTNLTTKEWKNGLMSHYMQVFSEEMTDGNPKWIVLDGDLDANWIESMNSVMDDNKLLTLANNGRIVFKGYMKLLLEIRNLKWASPATVSRGGIVYISDDSGYQRECYLNSWAEEILKDDPFLKKLVTDLFEKYVNKIINFMIREAKFVVPVSLFSMTMAMCKLLQNVLVLERPNISTEDAAKPIDLNKLEHVFNMCACWAYGGCLTEKDNKDYRKEFSNWWRTEFKPVKFPAKGLVFDYFVSFEENKVSFSEWKNKMTTIEYDRSMQMQSITVPIPETVSLKELSKYLIFEKHAVLYIGEAGSGKTQLIKGLLKEIRTKMPNDFYYSNINFNFYTDADYLQNMLEQDLVKQGNKYGPKKGSKIKLIYFIDDLNMPQLDAYETQSAIALLRQHIDYSHWYDISKATPFQKEIINTQVLAAMNPTSGSFSVNPRYQRHFWTAAISMPENNSLLIIYETFLKGHFKKFKSVVQEITVPLIKAALALHERVVSSFRKTAVNFHYEFNVRHISNIFGGILMSQPNQFVDQERVVRLWLHESERIYCDRLVTEANVQTYKNLAFDTVKKAFAKYNMQKYFGSAKPESLIFINFTLGFANDRFYDVLPLADAEKHINDALIEYNDNFIEMNLVLFEDAIKHVCRITRITSSPAGHAL